MKFIHCADLHLDSKIEGLPSEKSKIRREEILRSFERLCAYATENGVVAVIIAGDMFDTMRVTLKTRARVLNAIATNSGVDFLYLSGNHDDDNFIASIENLPSNLKLFSDSWISYEYDNTVISGVIIGSRNSLTVYDTLKLDADKLNIVVMHGQIVGYKSNEQAENVAIPRLKDKNIDYLALGHIHSYSEGAIDNRGKYAYSGCLDARGFDEIGEKGFVLVEADNNKIKTEFIPFSSRIFREISFSVSQYDNWLDARRDLLEKLSQECNENDLIKVVLKGEHKTDFDIDKDGLGLLLNQKFFFAKVYDRTQLKIELADYELDKSVRGEFVRTVLESELDELEKRKIIMCGLNALKGEDIL